jgi:hypothetical protein
VIPDWKERLIRILIPKGDGDLVVLNAPLELRKQIARGKWKEKL